MKDLIYTTAFGEDHFFALAEQMLRSLRGRGYAGDAIVLSDRVPKADAFPPDLGVRVVIAPRDKSRLFKASLPEHVDVSAYRAVLFVDTDVVFLSHPGPLLALAGPEPLVSRDHSGLKRNGFNRTFFNAEENTDAARKGTQAMNTGVILFSGPRCADQMALWGGAWALPEVTAKLAKLRPQDAELRDQPVLQMMEARGMLACGSIPDHLFLMPLYQGEHQPLHPDTVLLHLNGADRGTRRKLRLLEIMREITACVGHEEFREIRERMRDEGRRGARALRAAGAA